VIALLNPAEIVLTCRTAVKIRISILLHDIFIKFISNYFTLVLGLTSKNDYGHMGWKRRGPKLKLSIKKCQQPKFFFLIQYFYKKISFLNFEK
jgi:hypothetical protein